MWAGFLEMGGTEVVNSGRSLVYARESDCPIYWHKQYENHNTADALLDDGYSYAAIDAAPWYDPDEDDLSRRFYGVYGISIEGMSDSMRTATVTQKLGSGGIISGIRETTRQIRVRAFLSAEGVDALEYGTTWLREMVGGRGCSMHSSRCGMTDAGFFVDNPPGRDDDPAYEDDPTYIAVVRNLRRYTHNVAATSGPFVVQEVVSEDKRHHGRIVEFTLTSEVPWVYGEPRQIDIVPTVPFVVQDAPFNLLTHPSAEIAGVAVTVATNYSQNPSVETNATGWAHTDTVVSGSDPTPYITGARSTVIAADGVASYGVTLLGTGTTASGVADIDITHTVDISALATNARVSFSLWTAMFELAAPGITDLTSITVDALWYDGVSLLSTDNIGSTTDPDEFGGRVFADNSLPVPASADSVVVRARFRVSWQSASGANSNITMYADAAAVTVP